LKSGDVIGYLPIGFDEQEFKVKDDFQTKDDREKRGLFLACTADDKPGPYHPDEKTIAMNVDF
jgi:hypothetical protein